MRTKLKNYKRIVIKVGSSTLTHKESGEINYRKLEQLTRVLSDLRNQGKEVILVSSGAQAVGKKAVHLSDIPNEMPKKQALAAIGQARLMTTYQKLFSEYNQVCAQILLTKYTFFAKESRINALNTFNELLAMGVIPIVNENDTTATHEIEVGDNDHLSAFVLALVDADLLIILSDIDGFYNDDPSINKDAVLFSTIDQLKDEHFEMGKETSSSDVGTGGMYAKVDAARLVTNYGSDMVLVNGEDVSIIYEVLDGVEHGTYFKSNLDTDFDLEEYL